MPILNLRLSTPPDARQSAAIAATLSQLTAQLLHKAPELTSVAISHLDAAHWFVGGPSLQAQGKASFFLDILISDETNTAAEKAAYIAAVFAAMHEHLGALHEVSYIHVHDARQAAWGYGGLTQQFRAVRKALQPA
ncbi:MULTISPECIES: 4-oxalocrotonate tautomerase family protein [unclassified Janthinobacterium]|uniref:tautomerase family protein n=1 Tax=unclassified Janthinobacterium TaxID=2610881 RepID=UPI001E4B66A8|nr:MULTISPECIES: 4-oxalocrotonate tautomerase family protein [unclassified Janthinobacterium]MCC7645085.1 4-oxalocrotonate tautomerase family protein [Janthinobacterium sp. EB271-G4-3-1]MCC7694357.1 4-oxalocrotonate tautomerase family protein [Janthinobacterium sp. EB271-G4-3-2]